MSSKIPVHPAEAPIPAGAYTPAIIAGGFVFVSGQTPEKPGTSIPVQGDIKVQTKQVLENIKSILEAAGCTMNDIVKVEAHLANIRDFSEFNKVYEEYFAKPYPARITVQSVLPEEALLEIAVTAMKHSA
jgi:2-iminobutanoate/2-iminopropanoate deaminase